MTLADRLWSRTQVTPSGCREFTGYRGPKGYGELGRGPRGAGNVRAHRAAWEITHGPVPDGLKVLHSCDNPPCVELRHLFLGTDGDNARDKVAKGRARGARGEASGQVKLTDRQVAEIRSRYLPSARSTLGTGSSSRELADEFGVTPQYISQLARGLWRV